MSELETAPYRKWNACGPRHALRRECHSGLSEAPRTCRAPECTIKPFTSASTDSSSGGSSRIISMSSGLSPRQVMPGMFIAAYGEQYGWDKVIGTKTKPQGSAFYSDQD